MLAAQASMKMQLSFIASNKTVILEIRQESPQQEKSI
jgi:hypothetical protein